MSDLTIVIPSFGGAPTIEQTVRSAFAQGSDLRIVVVIDDDCAKTAAILDAFADDRILVIRNPRPLGAPAARNIGLARAQTPYVTFLDADDFYTGDFLQPLLRRMQETKADIGFGPSAWWSPQRGYERMRIPSFHDREDVFSKWFCHRINVNTASVMWRTEFVREIGGWDEKILRNQDGEIALRAVLKGAVIAQSDSGFGVWRNDRAAQRITTRTDNIASLLYVADKFLTTPSKYVSDKVRLATCACYCLIIAHLAFSNGRDSIGYEALERRHRLGKSDYEGSLGHVLSVATRLIPRGPRLLLWRAVRSTRDVLQAGRAKFSASREIPA